MSVRHSRWSVPLFLAVGVWVGVTCVSAEPGQEGAARASATDPMAVEPASVDPGTANRATEDTLALGEDPIESSRLLPVSGFS